jgi:predicted  nucleic acid-binding Zn-ribbon protein
MSNVFCGIGKLPKGKKLGSMKECVEHGQVRYYGLKKIDERLIESISKKGSKKLKSSTTDLKTQIQKLTIDLISIRGKIKNIEKKILKEKDDKKKKQLEKDIKTLSEKSKKLRSDIDKLEKQQNISKQKRLTKRLTKRSTKR